MNYTIYCDCGKSLVVRASDAGSQKSCLCGKIITVPSLSILRRTCEKGACEEDEVAKKDRTTLIFGTALAISLALGLLSPVLLIPLGFIMVFVGRFWFAIQILSVMAIQNAMMVFFVPFMPTLFLFKRFDIAWKPFLFGMAGIGAIVVGAFAVQNS